MRMLTIRHATDLQGLRTQLLDARLGSARSEAAIQALQKANPHIDFAQLRPGAVLFVPDTADFRASASASVPGQALAEFQQLLRTGLEAAVGALRDASKVRADDLTAVSAAVRTTGIRRAMEADPEVKNQLERDMKSMHDDREEAAKAKRDFAGAARAALASLNELEKLLR